MANNYGRRDNENYGHGDAERSGRNREQYNRGSRKSGRDYEDERDYSSRRYNRESPTYGYDATRDYDLGREDASGGYFTGDNYGSGFRQTGDSGRTYGANYSRDDYTGNYESDRGYGGNYSTRDDYDRQRNYGSYNTDRSDYNREYRTYGGRAGGDYRDTGGSYGRGYDRSTSQDYDYEERGWWDKASDTVASWLGDEDATRRRRMDERYEGQHRGRGPKNYKRSDARIEEDINDKLTYDSYIDASDITVSVSGGEVTLTGTVPNRFTKRQAEDIAESVSGVTNVENRIRVKQTGYSHTDSINSKTMTGGFGRESMVDPNVTTTKDETTNKTTGTITNTKTKTA